MEEFDDLKIQWQDVVLATNNFLPDKRIGRGGFGPVYKGELSCPEGRVTVACKRLDPKFGQGNAEFWKEIITLSKYKHKNLVSLLHFCIEGDERILVYEYASRGSLDSYLSDPTLTWTQRLKICIGAARALDYLHNPADTHQRILHRDIKSANILLDEQWNAKVSDFGLSKFGPANQPQTYLISNVVGTPGYCDPLYWETCVLSKESDVYSFGVVLFEVMCGISCCEYRDGNLQRILVPMWKKCFQDNRLDEIIMHDLRTHMEQGSLNTFSNIAYQCLKKTRKERPTMADIVQKLEIALEQQEIFEDVGKRMNFEGLQMIADLAVSPLSYITQSQLLLLFMNGVLIGDGKTWFSVNKKGQHYELISALKCVSTSDAVVRTPKYVKNSRFQYLLEYIPTQDLRLKVMTQFLSPNVTYVIKLVHRSQYFDRKVERVPFKYKLEEMREYSRSCVAYLGEDGWLRTELFQFTSTKNQHYFDIHFSREMRSQKHPRISILIEGIEFHPVDFENDEDKVDVQPTTYSYNDWGESMHYEFIISIAKFSNNVDVSMPKKELYSLLREGIYIKNSQLWLSISKKSKVRFMLPARAILNQTKPNIPSKIPHMAGEGIQRAYHSFITRMKRLLSNETHSSVARANLSEDKSGWNFLSLPGSRFKEVVESRDSNHLAFSFEMPIRLFSPETTYACYLVFRLPENASAFEGIVISSFEERDNMAHTPIERHFYLVTPPHTPIVEVSSGDERPSRTGRKIKGHPKLRKDGWMEIQLYELYNPFTPDTTYFYTGHESGYLKSLNGWNFTGLLVQGIEFRPAKVSFSFSEPLLG